MEEARRRRPAPRSAFGARVRPGAQPVVTYAVIVLCAVMYALQLVSDRVTQLFWYVPLYTSDIALATGQFEPWRMLTSSVLHSPASAMHILFNMMALWFVGRVMEPEIGRLRYGALLVLSALGGSVAVLILSEWNVPTVGASGAVFGLFGALFILTRASGAETGGIVALIGINMVVSFLVPNISWQGHLGGLVTGALVALIITRAPRRGRALWQGAGLLGVAALLVALTAVGAAMVSP
ncbi:rhomboid family intramembrane serine protease [Nesterenkonia flava]|uniref:Rhomboid family intramembrane serine protease n=1 Tax=Nesterenkonia flava TaxID=469799 RepID=A0ABU1FW18_9MICC|nr:rhomboid family intramembrane serine protease [Nesterenkonia flava]MDR5712881.1 rhomboid family intramembrane serine protease [Nesterenkonia flava]